jgi:cGMP-dependent protein kinase
MKKLGVPKAAGGKGSPAHSPSPTRPGHGSSPSPEPKSSPVAKPEEMKSLGSRLDPRKVTKKKAQFIDSRVAPEPQQEAPNAVVSDKPKTLTDRGTILTALSKHFIFNSLNDENRMNLIESMKFFRLTANEVVFEQNQPAMHFFVLASGRLDVIINGRTVNVIKPGEGFGELALLHDTPRSATIKTVEPCSLWAVDRISFREMLQSVNAQNYAENKAFVDSIALFSMLTENQKEALLNSLATHKFSMGQRIVNEGDPGDLFYIIKDGTVSCTKEGNEVRRLTKGEFFGEQALLYASNRTATVTAVGGEVKCLSIGRVDLVQVLGSQLQHIIYRNTQRMAFEKNDILKRLNKQQCDKLIDAMDVHTYTNGQTVIHQGEPHGAKLLVVLKGALGFSEARIVAPTLACVGETYFAGSSEGFYEDTYMAIGAEVHVAEISRAQFEECIGGALDQATVNNEALNVIKRVQLLRALPADKLNALIRALQIQDYADGQTIVQQHNPGDTFFIIKSGTVDVLKDGVHIRSITKLDYFGERSVLFDDFRSATIVAKGPVSCWILHKADFLQITDERVRTQLLKRIELQDDTIAFSNLVVVKTLGKGMFGNVFLCVNPEKGTFYALKTVSRRKVHLYDIHENILLERRILLQLDHVFIVKLVKTFKDEKRLYLLMEFVKGMDLFDVLRKMGLLNDADAKFFAASMILMIEHLHERDIIYRDLKPENIMVDDEGYLRLIDFGTAKIVHGRTYTIVGTPHYMAPEVIMGKGYGLVADFYSIGIILYELICGGVPFGEDEDDPYSIYEKVLEHRLKYPHFVDPRFPARPLIEQLLNQNPAMRTGGSIDNLKAHKWFKDFAWVPLTQYSLISKQLAAPYVPNVGAIAKEATAAIARRQFMELIDVSGR